MPMLAEEKMIAGNVAKTVGGLICVGLALVALSMYISAIV